MYFTQEDYKKIENWLHMNSVKDTEFQEALPFTGKEIVTVVQDGHNRKVNIQEFINQLYKHGVEDFLNVTNTYRANNITLKEAIRLIPAEARKEGQVITFLNTEGNWEIYQFIGKLNQWNNPTLWNNPFDWEKFAVDSILPDEEDLTKSEPDAKGNSYLSLKDRKYEPDKYSGLGRKILRRRVVEIEDPIYGTQEKNLLLQADFDEDNTIYEVRYDFDLNNKEIIIPNNCILYFKGGSFSNGLLKLNNTYIEGINCFDTSITLEGECSNDIIYSNIYKIDILGDKDISDSIQSIFNICKSKIVFKKGIYKFSRVLVDKDVIIDGNLSKFISAKPLVDGYPPRQNIITLSDANKVIIKNIHFEGVEGTGRDNEVKNESPLWIKDIANVSILNCIFSKFRGGAFSVDAGESEYHYKGVCLTCTGFKNLQIKNCEFYDNNIGEWIWVSPSPYGGSYIKDNTSFVFIDNYIHNYKNDESRGNTPLCAIATNIKALRNKVEYYSYRGSAFNLFGLNIVCNDNIVKECHFRSAIDTCEWGQFYNNYVEIVGNRLDVYNGCGCVINTRRAIIENNIINAECGVNNYSTYVEKESIVMPTIDDSCEAFGAGESITISNNKINANYVDLSWIWESGEDAGKPVNSGITNPIFIASFKELGKNITICNNNIEVSPIEGLTNEERYPIHIVNFNENISISNNTCNSNINAYGISSTNPGFVHVEKRIDTDLNRISILNNILKSKDIINGNSNTYYNIILQISNRYDTLSIIGKIKNIIIEGNLYYTDTSYKDISVWAINNIVESLTINQDNFSLSQSRFAALDVYTNFVYPYINTATPHLNTKYTYGSECVTPKSNLSCRAKYFIPDISGVTGEFPVKNSTLFCGDILRVSITCVYLLLSGTCKFTDTVPSIENTTSGNIISWADAKWLVLQRGREKTTWFNSGTDRDAIDIPSSDPYTMGIFFDIQRNTLSTMRNGISYDVKGWRDLGVKGNTTVMNSLRLGGADEGYLFFNTDVKLWCQLFVDRSDTPSLCWQILGNGVGSTEKRPNVLSASFGVGYRYYDTTLNKVIYWNGIKWVDATGADV